ncbi:hypothetical protein SEUCBS140593_008226 [Sporothrix eucalyptigena]|uniref:Uncharacterized protein n=1 Tax=Sporothrix eucalyptigena TaxID=1812306 RepID=A0ABP0CKC8_9PEZI
MRFRPLVMLLAGAVAIGEGRVAQPRDVANSDDSEHCPHDNLLRCLIGSPTLAYTFCSWSVGIYPTPVTIYDTVTVPATQKATSTTTSTASEPLSPTPTGTPTTTVSVSTVTITQTATAIQTDTQTVTLDHTQTTTDTVIQTISVVITATLAPSPTAPGNAASAGLANNAALAPNNIDTANTPRTTPKTSLACLDDLQPGVDGVTSACSCYVSSQPTPTATSTVTWVEGSPYCPGYSSSSSSGSSSSPSWRQPTFPNCFADFHPYNCGTDHVGQIACSCALTTEGTAQCTLGDYERDNACTTSDDCAAGWYCTVIECFGAGVPSVCTKACPVIFAQGGGYSGEGGYSGGDNDTDNDNAVPVSARPRPAALTGEVHSLEDIRTHNHNLSIIIVNNDANGFGSGRARGGQHQRGSS